MFMQAYEELAVEVVALREQLADLNRRVANMHRPGAVTEIDPATGTFRMAFADEDGNDVVSPKIPWTQRAGSQKEWDPPAVGEQMIMHSPSGEIGDGSWGSWGGFSDKFAANHDKGGEYKRNVGDHTSVLMTGDAQTDETLTRIIRSRTTLLESSESITLKAPTIILQASQKIVIDAPTIELDGQMQQVRGSFVQLQGGITSKGVHKAAGHT